MPATAIPPPVAVLLLAAVCLIVLPHITHIPTSVSAFFLLLLLWRFLAIWNNRLHPNRSGVFLLFATGILLLFAEYQGIIGRDFGTSLFVTALTLKLLEIKQSRDVYLLTYLAFFVAATQFLYQQNIFIAIYIIIMCCLLLAVLIAMNKQHAVIAVSLRQAVAIITQALPIMLVIFIFFPRYEAPRWRLFEQGKAHTGLDDTLQPGAISKLGLSGELAFRAKFDGDIPPPELRYWRGPAFSHTDGIRWNMQKFKGLRAQQNDVEFYGNAYQYSLLMEPQKHNWVYALDLPADFDYSLSQNPEYQLISSKNPNKPSEYQLTSFTRYKTVNITAKEKNTNLHLPENTSSRIIRLVEDLGGFQNKPENYIANTLKFFSNNNFIYTLNPLLISEKLVDTFLFETRRGFCSHYAAAFVYLMRTANIPARIITGYQGGKLNEVGNFLEIRQANAHAWAEVWLANKGWVRVDPTLAIAPERIEQDVNIDRQLESGEVNFSVSQQNVSNNRLMQLNQQWKNLDYSWQSWVINYDNGNQVKLFSFFNIKYTATIAYALLIMVCCITLFTALLFVNRKKRPTDKALLLYGSFCRKLAKSGHYKKPGEGANDFALRIRDKIPHATDKINQITSIYIKLRYSRRATQEDLKRLKRLITLFRV